MTFLQIKTLDTEASKQTLADAQAKQQQLQQRFEGEQASLQELEARIQQLQRREDNQQCIEARARRHEAEVSNVKRSCLLL